MTANEDSETSSSTGSVGIYYVSGRSKRIDVAINGCSITMDWDPGATQSIISTSLWRSIGAPKLKQAPPLRAYGNFKLEPRGSAKVRVVLGDRTELVSAVVMDKAKPMLFGLPWCKAFEMGFPEQVYSVQQQARGNDNTSASSRLKCIIEGNEELFGEKLGRVKDFQITIHVKEGAQPVHFAARPVNFGIQKNVEAELKRFLEAGIISAVNPNDTPVEWATPTVIVPKKNGAVRICGDFRTTLNPVLAQDTFPVPRFDQLRRQLANGQRFTKIDVKDAYLQFEVDPASRKYLVVSTHKGYFRYNRLPFGVASAPAIFQRYLEELLAGIYNIAVYFDDIAITGPDDETHLRNLSEVLKRLRSAGFALKRDKCTFMQPSIEYLGHVFSSEGVLPSPVKVAAIVNAPAPSNKTELRSFLGMANFYERFIPRLHGLCADLHEMTGHRRAFCWSKKEEKSFKRVKEAIACSRYLVAFNEARELFLATDASEKGVGAVLFHRDQRNNEQPIAFASRKLTDAERKYSVIDREALAIFYAIRKFDQYLRGVRFHLRTDHKPLVHIFGEKRNLPKLVNNRLTRWAIYIGQYNYEIEYRKGSRNQVADCLSRLPDEDEERSADEVQVAHISDKQVYEKFGDLELSEETLQKHTRKDASLKYVMWYMRSGWPTGALSEELKKYYNKKAELSVEGGAVMWQGRLVIPNALRHAVLERLHEGHPGITSMRALARFYVWWPRIDEDIEVVCGRCRGCQEHRQRPSTVPVYAWSLPDQVWERLHIDYAGPFQGKVWLIVVDALSKWVEVRKVVDMNANTLCGTMDNIFATFGLPQTIVSDNGRQFVSQQFREFCRVRGIRQVTAAPYHPRTNGLAERFVRTFKDRMRASSGVDNGYRKLHEILFSYRNTPHGTTGRSPAEAMFGRQLRCIFDNIKPNLKRRLHYGYLRDEIENSKTPRQFQTGQKVFSRTTKDKSWTPAEIVDRTGRYSYTMRTAEGMAHRRHTDQLRANNHDRSRYSGLSSGATSADVAAGGQEGDEAENGDSHCIDEDTLVGTDRETTPGSGCVLPDSDVSETPAEPARVSIEQKHQAGAKPRQQSFEKETKIRRSTRERKPPVKFDL